MLTSAMVPSSCVILLSISQSSSLLKGSTPVVGSSKSRSFGRWSKEHISDSFCIIPPLRLPASLSVNSASPDICKSFFLYSKKFLSCFIPLMLAKNSKCSSTLNVSYKTRPIPCGIKEMCCFIFSHSFGE